MDSELKYAWQQLVVDAFVASSGEVSPKVDAAARAIFSRIQTGDLDSAEEAALEDALRALRVLASEAKRSPKPHERAMSSNATAPSQTKRGSTGAV